MRQRTEAASWDDAVIDAISDDRSLDPEAFVLQSYEASRVRSAMQSLPVPLKEILFLRELQGMSYREIAEVIDHPIGTVMSRLSKARRQLQLALIDLNQEDTQ